MHLRYSNNGITAEEKRGLNEKVWLFIYLRFHFRLGSHLTFDSDLFFYSWLYEKTFVFKHNNESSDKANQPAAALAAATAAAKNHHELVVVHQLVLLSVVDHYMGIWDTKRRVVGVLLGDVQGRVDVTSSFAVPFEEDKRDPTIWYLDHNYLENMFGMFRKVNAKERILGFYSTGPKIRANDIDIDHIFRKYTDSPVFAVIDVRADAEGLPVQAYCSVEQVDDAKETKRTFKHIESEVGAYEAEEVGVEQLLRDVNDPTVTTLASRIKHKMAGLEGLKSRLQQMASYLEKVEKGDMPMNNQVMYNLQDIFNLLPNLNVESLVKAFMVKTNDTHLVVYMSTLIRAIIALHNLVNNKIKYARDRMESENGKKKEATGASGGAEKTGDESSSSSPSPDGKKGKSKKEGK